VSTSPDHPLVIAVAGPNGAGKSTAAPALLRDALEVREFVNADSIASGLSAFRPETVAISAGRIMLARMRQLAAVRVDFALETMLASRSFVPWLAGLRDDGYMVHLLFLSLRDEGLALPRVAERAYESLEPPHPNPLPSGARECALPIRAVVLQSHGNGSRMSNSVL
jgi:predicted ABC-type ATPase